MSDTDQLDTLKALAEVAREREPQQRTRVASVRVSPGSYLAAASVLTFCSAILVRSGQEIIALIAIVTAWVLMPLLASTDKIEFDGEFIVRTGILPYIGRRFTGRRRALALKDFERVETHALRTLRRKGSVHYRYRTKIVSRNHEFVFASGGRSYRQMIHSVLPLVSEEKLDLRSIELRDFLCEPNALQTELDSLHLASADVLESASLDFKLGARHAADEQTETRAGGDSEKVALLGAVANKLRIAGRFNEAREAFRRVLLVAPNDGRLLFQFARLLRSQASSLTDAKLLMRGRAALRLAARKLQAESEWLALIGESFLEWGDVDRAQQTLQKAIELKPTNVRARFGLAALALREGKLAHVIHQYRDAAAGAPDHALANHATREADYYSLLNDDDDYLTVELRRINVLQHALRIRRLAARVTNASILLALIISLIDSSIASFGWYLASSSLMAWLLSLLAIRLTAKRRTPRLAR